MIRIGAFLTLIAFAVFGCAPGPQSAVATRAVPIADSSLPPMRQFGLTHPPKMAMSNATLTRNFLDLHFQLESGLALPVFTRFETPISLRVIGAPPPSMMGDLRQLLARLQREAGISIALTASPDANITIQVAPRAQIQRAMPQAACFVVPDAGSLSDFRRGRSSSWTSLTRRDKVGIFVPSDASPQELRDCLHEELAQALGPLNDLYRLSNSVFNDDNIHTVLTDHDMLILRATYAPELRSGMNRSEVAAHLPRIFARINPAGRGRPAKNSVPTPRSWITATHRALSAGGDPRNRRNAAANALNVAQSAGLNDHRTAFSQYIFGRMEQFFTPQAAEGHFQSALRYLGQTPDHRLYRAHIAAQLAAKAITDNDPQAALAHIDPYLPVAHQAQNAVLLSTLMLLKSEALLMSGQINAARSVKLDSLGWARYGFGSDWAVRAKLREIAGLNPNNRLGG